MKIVACIPVKLNNERLPGKNIKRFSDGTPLIRVALNNLVKVQGLDEIYVFCSDDSICTYLINDVRFLRRPEYLDTALATPQDIISEFMKLVDADVYMISHVTSPFVSVTHLKDCIEAVLEDHDSAFTAHRIQKLLWKNDSTPLNFDPANVPRTQDLEPIYEEVSAAYVFKKETFVNFRRRIGFNPKIIEVSDIEAIDIDNSSDFEIADALYSAGLTGGEFL